MTEFTPSSALFGIGWGLAGYCPGPAVAGAGLADPKTLGFVAAMLAGMALYDLFDRWRLAGADSGAARSTKIKPIV